MNTSENMYEMTITQLSKLDRTASKHKDINFFSEEFKFKGKIVKEKGLWCAYFPDKLQTCNLEDVSLEQLKRELCVLFSHLAPKVTYELRFLNSIDGRFEKDFIAIDGTLIIHPQ